MDRETLSHYGWIVVTVLVISVLLSFATPFSKYIATAIKNTTQALFEVTKETIDDNNTGGSATTKKLSTPSLSIHNGVLYISKVYGATSYEIYIDGTLITTTSQNSEDLNEHFTKSKTYVIDVIAIGSGYKSSNRATINYVVDGNGNGTGEPVTCTHNNKEYTFIDQSLHNVECNSCHEDLGKQSHTDANGDYKCDLCLGSLPAPCSHTNKSYNYISIDQHSIRCSDCSKDLGKEAHFFSNGACTKCDYTCPHYDKDYTDNGDNTHNVDCDNCGKDLGDENHGFIDGTCDDCGNVCKHDNTSYLPLSNTHHNIKCDNCKKILETERHSFKNGVCEKCGEGCSHEDKTYTFINNNTHDITCNNCSGDLGSENHNYVNGTCTKCQGSCTHTSKTYSPLDNANHSITCDNCSKHIGNEAHNYVNGICTKCDYNCTHENKTYTPINDTTHKVTCDDCGKDLGNENHNYNGGSCEDCENNCTHNDKSYTPVNKNIHTVMCNSCKETLGNEGHTFIDGICNKCNYECQHENIKYTDNGDGTHNKECADCGKDFGDEDHNYNDGTCDDCMTDCQHLNATYTPIDLLQHSVSCNDCNCSFNEDHNYVNEICTKCNRERNLIPVGDTYYIGVTSIATGNYTGATQTLIGDGLTVEFPETIKDGDVYVSGDYEYRYNQYYYFNSGWEYSRFYGWGVRVLDTTKTEYGEILESVNGSSIKYLHCTFYNCSNLLVAPEIPASVTYIAGIFSGCTSLTTAPAIPSNISSMYMTFNGCTNLKTYHGSTDADGDFSNYVIPSSVTSMYHTFSGCTFLTKAPTIPNKIMSLSNAFNGCSSLVEAPDLSNCSNLTDMSFTFQGCTSLEIAPVIPSRVTNMGSTFNGCEKLRTYHGSTDADGDFSNYVIPDGVTNMGTTFRLCKLLTTSPVIPYGVTDIHDIFVGCTSLVEAPIIPNSVTNMSGAFSGCTSLTTAPVIPSSVTKITWLFNQCSSLVTYHGSTDADGDFSNYVIPYGVTSLQNTFSSCTSLTKAPEIPASVTNMYCTFRDCKSLAGIITINGNITSYRECFANTVNMIYLTGSSETLVELAATDGYTDFSENDRIRVYCEHTNKTYAQIDAINHSVTCTDCGCPLDNEQHGFVDGVCIECSYACLHSDMIYSADDIYTHTGTCLDCGKNFGKENHEDINSDNVCDKCSFELCAHQNITYTPIDVLTHSGDCNNCDYTLEENHDYVNEICTKCNKERNVIPEGGQYIPVDGPTLEGGDEFPETVKDGDTFVYGDYEYRYNMFYNGTEWKAYNSQNGWGVRCINNIAQPGVILESINGKSITRMSHTFANCTNLVISPEIPSTVTNMQGTFRDCTSLTTAPIIPENVKTIQSLFVGCTSLVTYHGSTDTNGSFRNYTIPSNITDISYVFQNCTSLKVAPVLHNGIVNMCCTFMRCSSLTTVPNLPNAVVDMTLCFQGTKLSTIPTIPSSVIYMESTFQNCTYLSGTITINANPTSYDNCFDGARNRIDLTGASTLLAELAFTDGFDDFSISDYVRVLGKIPTGGTYYVGVTSTATGDYSGATQTLVGDGSTVDFPETVTQGDVYVYGDYEYRYGQYYNGSSWVNNNVWDWGVMVLDNTKKVYGEILNEINGAAIEQMDYTFSGCTSLEVAPEIPNGVKDMKYTFSGCTNLKTYTGSTDADGDFSGYIIPNKTTIMTGTFKGCTSLVVSPVLPSDVQMISYLFENCDNLTTAPTLPFTYSSKAYSIVGMFKGCTSLVTYHGSTDADGDFSNYVIPSLKYLTSMISTFQGCSSLEVAPAIPSTVTNMERTFYYCTSLTGSITINATPTEYDYCFKNTGITEILGDCENKTELLATK